MCGVYHRLASLVAIVDIPCIQNQGSQNNKMIAMISSHFRIPLR